MSQHQQRLLMEDVPLLIPDDDNDYSFDSSVELSFFDTSSILPSTSVYNRSQVERPFTFAPVRPLELKRRKEQFHHLGNREFSSLYPLRLMFTVHLHVVTFDSPIVPRSVSDNVVLQQRRPPPPPPRASVMPRSPSITSRSSLTDIMAPSFAMTTSSFQPRRLTFDEPAETVAPLRSLSHHCSTAATGSHLPNATGPSLRRTLSSPSPISPTDMHFGLERYDTGAYDVGFSPD